MAMQKVETDQPLRTGFRPQSRPPDLYGIGRGQRSRNTGVLRGGWVEGAGSVFDTGFGSGRVDQRVTLRMFEG